MFSDQKRIKSEVSKILRKTSDFWKLNNPCLNNLWFKKSQGNLETISNIIMKYEITKCVGIAKTMPRKKSMSLDACVQKDL